MQKLIIEKEVSTKKYTLKTRPTSKQINKNNEKKSTNKGEEMHRNTNWWQEQLCTEKKSNG